MDIITDHSLENCYRLYQAENGTYVRVRVEQVAVPSGKSNARAYRFTSEITDASGEPLLFADAEGVAVPVFRVASQTQRLDQTEIPVLEQAEAVPVSLSDGALVRVSGRLYQGWAGEVLDRGPIEPSVSAAVADLIANLDEVARAQVKLLAASYERIAAQAEINALLGES